MLVAVVVMVFGFGTKHTVILHAVYVHADAELRIAIRIVYGFRLG